MNKENRQFYLFVDEKPVAVTEEVYRAFWHYTNKEDYFMRLLKRRRRVWNKDTQSWMYVPARECYMNQFFGSEDRTRFISEEFEPLLLSDLWVEQLMELLEEQEREIVLEFYINGKTEREMSAELGIPKTTFHRRAEKLRKKLRILLNDFL